jgi:hypothetical protein
MKNLKHLIILCLVFVVGSISCSPEDDLFVDPGDDRDKFVGVWSVSESCFKSNYTVSITNDPSNSAQVLLANFGNPGSSYAATVGLVAGSKIFVSNQTIGDGWTISGLGTLAEPNLINWTYSLTIAGNKLECSSEFTR